MWNGFPTRALVAALALAAAASGAAAGDALPLTLEDAIARALEHNRQLVKGALDLQGYRLAAERAQETVRGIQLGMADLSAGRPFMYLGSTQTPRRAETQRFLAIGR